QRRPDPSICSTLGACGSAWGAAAMSSRRAPRRSLGFGRFGIVVAHRLVEHRRTRLTIDPSWASTEFSLVWFVLAYATSRGVEGPGPSKPRQPPRTSVRDRVPTPAGAFEGLEDVGDVRSDLCPTGGGVFV